MECSDREDAELGISPEGLEESRQGGIAAGLVRHGVGKEARWIRGVPTFDREEEGQSGLTARAVVA